MTVSVIQRFERVFADWLGAEAGFAFWKGRVGIYATLKAMGVGEGDEVILPGYTCVMDVNPVMYLRAKPVYVDINPVTYNLDPDRLEEAITPRTRVIIAQHTYGYPCEMDAILEVAERHGISVVEDCCLALGSTYKGTVCGRFGVAAVWSFQWNKPFACGLGGLVTVNDPALGEKIAEVCRAELQGPGRSKAWQLGIQRQIHRMLVFPSTASAVQSVFRRLGEWGVVIGSSSASEFVPEMPEGFLMGMSAGQARVGLRQMERIQQNISHRRRLATVYDGLLREAGWEIPAVPDSMNPVLVRYPVRVADKGRAQAIAMRHLVELGVWFESPLHAAQGPLEAYNYQPGTCPTAEKAAREVVNLPTHLRAGERTARRSVRLVCKIGPAQ